MQVMILELFHGLWFHAEEEIKMYLPTAGLEPAALCLRYFLKGTRSTN